MSAGASGPGRASDPPSDRVSVEVVVYRLADRALLSRARGTAVIGVLGALAPVALVVVLLRRLGFGEGWWVPVIVGVVLVLTVVRGLASYRWLVRRLRAFEVTADLEGLSVKTASSELRVGYGSVRGVSEIPGFFGGLRLELRESEEAPSRVDVPRGGERFGELRARLELACGRVARTPRRGLVARLALGGAVVAGIFFLPFVIDDLPARSRLFVVVGVVGAWLVARWFVRR